jgi:cytochrome P450
MTATIWRLSQPENRAHQEKLRQELHDAGVCAGTHPDLSAIQQLPFLTNVLRETLRLDPPVPFGLPRVVKEGQDVTIMGVRIKPGVC